MQPRRAQTAVGSRRPGCTHSEEMRAFVSLSRAQQGHSLIRSGGEEASVGHGDLESEAIFRDFRQLTRAEQDE